MRCLHKPFLTTVYLIIFLSKSLIKMYFYQSIALTAVLEHSKKEKINNKKTNNSVASVSVWLDAFRYILGKQLCEIF